MGNTEITATEDTIGGLLSRDYQYVVPEYQRQYSWTEEHWDDLWNDIESIEHGDEHFLGSVVLVERDTDIDEKSRYEIVDGQQRLTTVSILLCAIREYYDSNGQQNAVEAINHDYLWEKGEDFRDLQKLKLNKLDNDQYRRLLQGNLPRQSESNIRRAIEYFGDKIVGFSDKEVDDLRKKLKNAVTLVAIECDSEESAFRLFETLNNRGLELSEIDLMKNYLYKLASEDDQINEEAIKQDWETTVDNIRYELDKPHRFFIHYILYSPTPNVTDNITQNTLYDTFRELVEGGIPNSNITLEEYISTMADDTILYLNIVNSEVTKYNSEGNDRINSLLSDLDRLGYTQERTYLMGVLDNIDNATNAVRSIQLIESFIMRQRFTTQITGSDTNELYADICANAFERDEPVRYIRSQLVEEAPGREEFVAAVAGNDFPRSERTLFLLERLEEKTFNNSNVVSGEIEHIAPRKLDAKKYNGWKRYLDCSQEEFDQIKDKLGNLTILESRLNLEASNNPFEQKKREYNKSEYKMAKSLTTHPEWSITEIEERTSELAQSCADVWDFDI